MSVALDTTPRLATVLVIQTRGTGTVSQQT
jgi:hypothetical protein